MSAHFQPFSPFLCLHYFRSTINTAWPLRWMRNERCRWMRGLNGVKIKEQEKRNEQREGWIIWWTKGSFWCWYIKLAVTNMYCSCIYDDMDIGVCIKQADVWVKVPVSVWVSGNFVFICLKPRARADIFHETVIVSRKGSIYRCCVSI